MLKLKLQYFGHQVQSADSLGKTLMLGKIEGGRRRGRQRMDGVTDSTDMSLSKLWERVEERGACRVALNWTGSQRLEHDLASKQQQQQQTLSAQN